MAGEIFPIQYYVSNISKTMFAHFPVWLKIHLNTKIKSLEWFMRKRNKTLIFEVIIICICQSKIQMWNIFCYTLSLENIQPCRMIHYFIHIIPFWYGSLYLKFFLSQVLSTYQRIYKMYHKSVNLPHIYGRVIIFRIANGMIF